MIQMSYIFTGHSVRILGCDFSDQVRLTRISLCLAILISLCWKPSSASLQVVYKVCDKWTLALIHRNSRKGKHQLRIRVFLCVFFENFFFNIHWMNTLDKVSWVRLPWPQGSFVRCVGCGSVRILILSLFSCRCPHSGQHAQMPTQWAACPDAHGGLDSQLV